MHSHFIHTSCCMPLRKKKKTDRKKYGIARDILRKQTDIWNRLMSAQIKMDNGKRNNKLQIQQQNNTITQQHNNNTIQIYYKTTEKNVLTWNLFLILLGCWKSSFVSFCDNKRLDKLWKLSEDLFNNNNKCLYYIQPTIIFTTAVTIF